MTCYDQIAAHRIQRHYTVDQVAELYQVSAKSVRRWISLGLLKAHKIGGSVRVPASELVKFVEVIGLSK